ncbi:MAG: rhodanese-like domain-containing protein [Phycisphaerales bacterium]
MLDTRRRAELAQGFIPGAMNVAHTRLLANMAGVPKDRPVLVNCQGGVRSARACSLLQKHGYKVTNLAGGFAAWAKAGAPVQR